MDYNEYELELFEKIKDFSERKDKSKLEILESIKM